MKKRIVLTLGFCLVAIAVASCQPEPQPEEVVASLSQAVNNQDLDGALALFAEDALVNTGGPAPFTGKAEIRGWLEGMFADNFKIEAEILEVKDNTVLERDKMSADTWQEMGMQELEGTSEITVIDGKITSLNFTFDEASLAQLQEAMLKAAKPTHADVPYLTDGDPKHTVDIYLPEGMQGPLPTVFFIHGADDPKEAHNGLGGYFAQQGYAAVLIEYGAYSSPSIGNSARDFQNAFCALAWLHANAEEYGFDRERVVIFGYSIGGLMAATLASVDDASLFMADCPHALPEAEWTRGVATYEAVLATPEACLSSSWCLSGAAADTGIPLTRMLEIFETLRDLPPSRWRDNEQLSPEAQSFAQNLPLSWVDGSEPPFLLIHGSTDEEALPADSIAFARWLEEAGVEAELVRIEGADHFSIYPRSPNFIPIVEAVATFANGLLEK